MPGVARKGCRATPKKIGVARGNSESQRFFLACRVRFDIVRLCKVRLDIVRLKLVRLGRVRFDRVRLDIVRLCKMRFDRLRLDMVRCKMKRLKY